MRRKGFRTRAAQPDDGLCEEPSQPASASSASAAPTLAHLGKVRREMANDRRVQATPEPEEDAGASGVLLVAASMFEQFCAGPEVGRGSWGSE